MPLKKKILKKPRVVEQKQTLLEVKGEISDVLLKIEKSFSIAEKNQPLTAKKKITSNISELRGISIKINSLNIPEQNKYRLLINLYMNVQKQFSKVKSLYPQKDGLEIQKRINSLLPKDKKKVEKYVDLMFDGV